jgi:hypothetical protein
MDLNNKNENKFKSLIIPNKGIIGSINLKIIYHIPFYQVLDSIMIIDSWMIYHIINSIPIVDEIEE